MPTEQKQYFVYNAEGEFVSIFNGTPEQLASWLPSGHTTGDRPVRKITREEVNEERDRRTLAGLPYDGHVYDFDQRGKDNITGASALAKFAMIFGAQPGDLKWHVTDPALKDAAPPFSWITQDNTLVPLDAPSVSALGDAAADWETRHVFAARNLKSMNPIPLDFQDDKYWP